MTGARLGPYQIVRLLGTGGMGAVYEARHEATGLRVAVKVLHPEHAQDKTTMARFFNEARAVNVVRHSCLVQISDFGQAEDGTAYLAMEYLEGESVRQRLDRCGPFSESDALSIVARLASALTAAHARGIIHRDLKPGNVMLVPDPTESNVERVKLLDFGIAKVSLANNLGSDPQTQTGLPMGTPLYMSPEQCRGAARVDAQTDVYSLGVMLYEMLAGRPPFLADNVLAVLNAHTSAEPPPLKSFVPQVSPAVETLVQAMLRKDKDARPTMEQAEALAKTPGQVNRSDFTQVVHSKASSQAFEVSTTNGSAAELQSRPRRWPVIAATMLGCAVVLAVVTLRIRVPAAPPNPPAAPPLAPPAVTLNPRPAAPPATSPVSASPSAPAAPSEPREPSTDTPNRDMMKAGRSRSKALHVKSSPTKSAAKREPPSKDRTVINRENIVD